MIIVGWPVPRPPMYFVGRVIRQRALTEYRLADEFLSALYTDSGYGEIWMAQIDRIVDKIRR